MDGRNRLPRGWKANTMVFLRRSGTSLGNLDFCDLGFGVTTGMNRFQQERITAEQQGFPPNH
jgi:hypothetical protein